jgi:hypothetical protein
MASKLEFFGLAAAAIAAGTVYVLVHEARRKRRKAEKEARDAPITKEVLLKILNKSAEASKTVIERVRTAFFGTLDSAFSSRGDAPVPATVAPAGVRICCPCACSDSVSRRVFGVLADSRGGQEGTAAAKPER